VNNNALILFTRNPELGKCKTRLAKTIGDVQALNIYKYLLKHTANISKQVNADRFVFYSEQIIKEDIWDSSRFYKMLQKGEDLGARMHHAFQILFNKGYKKCIIIGSDLYDLHPDDIEKGYKQLENSDVVIGPSEDGGYYLLGIKSLQNNIFKNKAWGTDSVFQDTVTDLEKKNIAFLDAKNDIDTWDDIKDIDALVNMFNLKPLKKQR